MKNIKNVAKTIQESKHLLAISGAGISTESGLLDFRSKKGLYNFEPETILSKEFFFEKTDIFYEFIEKYLYQPSVKPNVGHDILAKWEKEGRMQGIITQNIDNLHQQAGSQNVIEFHGTMHTAACTSCGKTYTLSEVFQKKQKQENEFYRCDCGEGLIKPDIVLYNDAGKWFHPNNFYELQCMVYDADVILVLGTTLQVAPFATLLQFRNVDANTPVIVINQGSTSIDKQKDVYLIKDSIGKVLTEIDKNMQ